MQNCRIPEERDERASDVHGGVVQADKSNKPKSAKCPSKTITQIDIDSSDDEVEDVDENQTPSNDEMKHSPLMSDCDKARAEVSPISLSMHF